VCVHTLSFSDVYVILYLTLNLIFITGNYWNWLFIKNHVSGRPNCKKLWNYIYCIYTLVQLSKCQVCCIFFCRWGYSYGTLQGRSGLGVLSRAT